MGLKCHDAPVTSVSCVNHFADDIFKKRFDSFQGTIRIIKIIAGASEIAQQAWVI